MSKKKTQKIYRLNAPTDNTTISKNSNKTDKPENTVNTFFENFMKRKICHRIDNEHITVIPYCVSDFTCGEKTEDDEVVCYEIYPKSNNSVVVYIDDKDLSVALDKKVLNLNTDETAFMIANLTQYIEKYCV